eukprot:COSAG01_NODE_5607_length_4149_cov_9.144198_2_plen_701_part_00
MQVLHRVCKSAEALKLVVHFALDAQLCQMEDWWQWTLLHHAAHVGDLESLTALLLACPDLLDVRDSQGKTPLHRAAQWGQTSCAHHLLSCGANPIVRNKFGMTPLQDALRVDADHEAVVLLLLSNEHVVADARASAAMGCVDVGRALSRYTPTQRQEQQEERQERQQQRQVLLQTSSPSTPSSPSHQRQQQRQPQQSQPQPAPSSSRQPLLPQQQESEDGGRQAPSHVSILSHQSSIAGTPYVHPQPGQHLEMHVHQSSSAAHEYSGQHHIAYGVQQHQTLPTQLHHYHQQHFVPHHPHQQYVHQHQQHYMNQQMGMHQVEIQRQHYLQQMHMQMQAQMHMQMQAHVQCMEAAEANAHPEHFGDVAVLHGAATTPSADGDDAGVATKRADPAMEVDTEAASPVSMEAVASAAKAAAAVAAVSKAEAAAAVAAAAVAARAAAVAVDGRDGSDQEQRPTWDTSAAETGALVPQRSRSKSAVYPSSCDTPARPPRRSRSQTLPQPVLSQVSELGIWGSGATALPRPQPPEVGVGIAGASAPQILASLVRHGAASIPSVDADGSGTATERADPAMEVEPSAPIGPFVPRPSAEQTPPSPTWGAQRSRCKSDLLPLLPSGSGGSSEAMIGSAPCGRSRSQTQPQLGAWSVSSAVQGGLTLDLGNAMERQRHSVHDAYQSISVAGSPSSIWASLKAERQCIVPEQT